MKINLLFSSKLLLFLTILSLVNSSKIYAQSLIKKKETITVGIFADRGKLEAHERWQKTIDLLNTQIPHYHFVLQPLLLEQLQQEISQQRLPFIIVNPSECVRIGRKYPLARLATLISPIGDGSTFSTGSAVWVKATSNITTISSLSGHRIGTASQQAFGGFMAFAREIAQNYALSHYFHQLIELGYPHESVVRALISGNIDAAILPVCLVESMISKKELKEDELRIIGQQNSANDMCMTSTPLYPNWSFAMTSTADRPLAKQIIKVLLNIPPHSLAAKSAQSLGWSVPESEVELDKLFSELGVHPLQKQWWHGAWQWLVNNYYIALIILILFTILPSQYIFLTVRYRRNSYKLRCAQESLQLVHRRALVDRLGSSLAHELNQPLAAIRLYAEGEISRRKQGRLDTDITLLLSKIQRQAIRIDEVVSRFRSLLQKKTIEKELFDINSIIMDAISLVEVYANQQQIHLYWQDINEKVYLLCDKAAIEQLLVNLLTNAIDATKLNKQEKVSISLLKNSDKIQLEIQDQGQGLPMPFEQLLTPFITTKKHGIGLGLAICKEVTESHQGELELLNIPSLGCLAIVRFPYVRRF
ncbi:sensor histidine kinase [Photobacterium damselae]|uniref:histidine kinase n=2 Tax=Photobacterium damselae TaxID=38293 RepID=D0Z327_PHODD|nr:sensor histidine kinase [Photobacterium damselae]EEZ39808.1 tetrathionate reductase sensory transduction histidine kinase [Photobacterium damselae subsp. damselae CIP 102761]SPY43913.1 Sensor protein fixL [Photobacterium damselae]